MEMQAVDKVGFGYGPCVDFSYEPLRGWVLLSDAFHGGDFRLIEGQNGLLRLLP